MSLIRELIPREDWFRAEWLELPDPMSTGFHFLGRGSAWHDREVRRHEIEAESPRSRHQETIARRRAATSAAIDRNVRPETIDGGWIAIAKLIQADCGVTVKTRGFGDKQIERDFWAELVRRGLWTRKRTK